MISETKVTELSGARAKDLEKQDAIELRASSIAAFDDLPKLASPLTFNKWQDIIYGVVNSVVSIHFVHTISFDTEISGRSEATGFVVDANLGLILTNRHVIGPGPFVGYAIFDNHEEVALKPIFRDPVHDFGFLQFDPHEIKHMKVEALELKPELAQVGTEIRVVGNDNGEKLSILAGFISRADRNPPDYGEDSYSDYNTEYLQAAVNASGGSSGSPVINSEGDTVGIQAGGATSASTDYFLPLFRPRRALECIQQVKPITRGDIQVKWTVKSYGECKRLGLSDEAETRARKEFPNRFGMVVADLVIPESPVENVIKEGDILISIDGELIPSQIRIDEILDENVGKKLEFVFQRGKGEYIQESILIGDINEITPSRYVEALGNIFHELSYQIALKHGIPTKGVMITNNLSNEITSHSIIQSIDGIPTPDLDSFIAALQTIPHYKKVCFEYQHVSHMRGSRYASLYVNKHWSFEFRLATRNDDTGLWDFNDLKQNGDEPAIIHQIHRGDESLRIGNDTTVGQIELDKRYERPKQEDEENEEEGEKEEKEEKKEVQDEAKGFASRGYNFVSSKTLSIMSLFCCISGDQEEDGMNECFADEDQNSLLTIDKSKALRSVLNKSRVSVHYKYRSFENTFFDQSSDVYGFVIDTTNGYVLTSFFIPDHYANEIFLEFYDSSEVQAKIVFAHPFHGYIVLKYDPDLVSGDIKQLQLGEEALEEGDECFYYGSKPNGFMCSKVTIEKVEPKECVEYFKNTRRFINFESISLDIDQTSYVGVLADVSGAVRGFRSMCTEEDSSITHNAMDFSDMIDVIEHFQEKRLPPNLRIIEAEFSPISLVWARSSGLPQEWVSKFDDKSDDAHLLKVASIHAPTLTNKEKCPLQNGDILLTVNDTLVKSMRELSIMYKSDSLNFKVFRNREELDLVVPTLECNDVEASRIIQWCGASIEESTYHIRQKRKLLPSGVYITGRLYGSIAKLYDLPTESFITEVNDQETKDLDAFMGVIRSVPDHTSVKVRVVSNSLTHNVAIKTGYHYFPTREFRKNENNDWKEVIG